ncbi:MAG: DNA-3-methyladenine glycosylase [Deltaproteobacteria bacterium]|nr:DNA-3-methyladenine glycosylase [Deltaproteobacteria bacterium]
MLDTILPQSFYARDALVVARDLLGCVLVRDGVALRITETEAYRHPDDSANHCRFGRTPRNAPMWGAPGHAYVYVCYGLHAMLNLVTDADGEGAAVLIRACEIVDGHAIVRGRRGGVRDEVALLAGPGKVGAALGLDTRSSGHALFERGGLEVHEGRVEHVLVGPRVGIDYARPSDREAPYRFADARSRVVTRRRTLTPLVRYASTRGHTEPG